MIKRIIFSNSMPLIIIRNTAAGIFSSITTFFVGAIEFEYFVYLTGIIFGLYFILFNMPKAELTNIFYFILGSGLSFTLSVIIGGLLINFISRELFFVIIGLLGCIFLLFLSYILLKIIII
jgi:hypothetical protein